jgi:hypothetical protein
MQAVTREFVRRNVVPEIAGRRDLDQQIPDHMAKLLLRSGDLLVSRFP